MSDKLIVGIYHSAADAENAISQLSSHGFPVSQLYVIAKDFETDETTAKVVENDDLKTWFERHFGWLIGLKHLFKYNQHFRAGKFLLVASGTEDEIARAWGIIRETGYVEADKHEEGEPEE